MPRFEDVLDRRLADLRRDSIDRQQKEQDESDKLVLWAEYERKFGVE